MHLAKWISVEHREEVHEKILGLVRYLLWDRPQNWLLIFFEKNTHSKKTWKSSRISSKKVTNYNGKPWKSSRVLRVKTKTLEIFGDFAFVFCMFLHFLPFFHFSFFPCFFFLFFFFLLFHLPFLLFLFQSSEQTPKPEKNVEKFVL